MSRFAIAPTDLGWFDHLRGGPPLTIINFWTPTPWGVQGLKLGDRLYFMLKAPIRKIGGYGEFVRYADMSASDAWEAYGLGNGVDSKAELVRKIEHFAAKRSQSFHASDNPVIGCIELKDSVFLDQGAFVIPEDCGHAFPIQVVKLKYFDEPDGIAARIADTHVLEPFSLVAGNSERVATSRKDRKGQSLFRLAVLAGYGHRCCITGESIGELLEAAHIQPYVDERSNHVQNGLCLRVDLHRLFDAGLISISEEDTVEVSGRLTGTSYARFHGNALDLPKSESEHPSAVALKFHRDNVFR